MVNPYEKFMFASYSIGCHSIVLATMDEENLHPFRLRNAINTFTCEFRNNLRSALLEDLQTNGSKRGKVNSPRTYISRFSYPLPYTLKLRVVRTLLPNGTLETLLTSLPRDEFSVEEVVACYRLRWREELFFRHILYDYGASRMKARKEDYSRQEILGHFVTSAAVWKIINGIALEQKPGNAYEYRINIKMATYLVKNFWQRREQAANNS